MDKNLKRNGLLACLLFLLSGQMPVLGQDVARENKITTLILVRHAEKVADGSDDPPLSREGQARAKAFARMFSRLNADAVYSSDYSRTRSTAKPLADQQGLSVQLYDPKTQNEFLDSLLEKHQGGTVVVVGHSNTIPFAVNHLLREDMLEEMPETEYDKVFIVSIPPHGAPQLVPLVLDL